MKVSRVLHAGYIFESLDTRILFDPVFESLFSVNCYSFPEVDFDNEIIKNLKITAIFISHIHEDHFSVHSLNLLDKNIPVYIYTQFEEALLIIKRLGFKSVSCLNLDQPLMINNIEVIARSALNPEMDCVFEIKCEGLKILNVVDSWLDPLTYQFLVHESPWDLILWPFQILREAEVLSPKLCRENPEAWPQEWIEQLKMLNPRCLIPSSCQFRHEDWSWYNKSLFSVSYADFFQIVENHFPKTQALKLNPGQSLVIEKNNFSLGPALDWIQYKNFEDSDYFWDKDFTILNQNEISKKFPGLSILEKEVIQNFLELEIIPIFFEIGPSNALFFNVRRFWKLSVFDSQGFEIVYSYIIDENQLIRTHTIENSPYWHTQISEFKLYCALRRGEPITSLYIQVREHFNEDVLEDPLIRILSARDPLKYQKYQLLNVNNL